MTGTHLLKRGGKYAKYSIDEQNESGLILVAKPEDADAMSYSQALKMQMIESEIGYDFEVVPVPPYLMMERTGQRRLFDNQALKIKSDDEWLDDKTDKGFDL